MKYNVPFATNGIVLKYSIGIIRSFYRYLNDDDDDDDYNM